ncbi:hypothetical protein CTAYLR_004744 [Chrysophaeum taylorii]|uniref:Uncharacterized protein n=1 Tax=Chrysophaeum taylorii TaxID=2483200 RepID=A0AAD7XFU5_9STRA|nr:hypothetical protein CTAYLR_004744 [Chrysophaeum taylorii]
MRRPPPPLRRFVGVWLLAGQCANGFAVVPAHVTRLRDASAGVVVVRGPRTRTRTTTTTMVGAAIVESVGASSLEGVWVGRRVAAFGALFVCSAMLHAAEVAITTLYPWKVKEFAEEEGPRSPFAMLDLDITRALTAILVATTCCNVCSTAIFTSVAGPLCDGSPRHFAYATAALTALTLFFGELLPKAMGVNNAERIARILAPTVNAMTLVLGPVGSLFSKTAKNALKHLFGVRLEGVGTAVSEEELRLIVGGATKSGGIESLEGTMIEGVLDLQDTRVSEIMRPRVEVKALEQNDTMLSLLRLVNATGHSRIPVYDDEIDNIVGVVNAKKLLDFVQSSTSSAKRPLLLEATIKECCEPTYFVPETMPAWKVLEEMRRRRVHMAIVVDEFGGTAGMVTLEDILELVVGEIYDEDDDQELDHADDILRNDLDSTFHVRGTASIDALVSALEIDAEDVDVDAIPDVTTAAGFVCYYAGEIPATGDHVFVANYDFEILRADERRVYALRASPVDASPVDASILPQPDAQPTEPAAPP